MTLYDKKLGFVYTVRQSLINWPRDYFGSWDELRSSCRCGQVAVVENKSECMDCELGPRWSL